MEGNKLFLSEKITWFGDILNVEGSLVEMLRLLYFAPWRTETLRGCSPVSWELLHGGLCEERRRPLVVAC